MNHDYHVIYPAILGLEDGSIFQGVSLQSEGIACGEVVFNTAMTGYQEILTDCSYAGQMVTFTYPHIGNVGINAFDAESDKIWPQGIIVRSLSSFPSNWRSTESLPHFLQNNQCLLIGDIDTRALTQKIRSHGALKGCIMVGQIDAQHAVQMARDYQDLENKDFSEIVSTRHIYEWHEGSLISFEYGNNQNTPSVEQKNTLPHIVVYDYGVKRSILRCLIDLGCRVTVVPASTPATQISDLSPHGILLSNGPGDPKLCTTALENIKQLLKTNIPILGICLGHQLLTIALGGKTTKMKFGHHGANHPVQDLKTSRVLITSQNHSFMMDETSLSKDLAQDLEITHRSLFDNTPQGFKHRTKAIWGFQGHPEANPGPHDANIIFEEFILSVKASLHKTKQFSREAVNA